MFSKKFVKVLCLILAGIMALSVLSVVLTVIF